MKARFVAILLQMSLLVACGTPAPVALQTATQTPRPILSPAASEPRHEAWTPGPTLTPSITPTFDAFAATMRAQMMDSKTHTAATREARSIFCGAGAAAYHDDAIYTSPDSTWTALNCESVEGQFIRFFRSDGAQDWQIFYDELPWFGKEASLNSLGPWHWTKDGGHVYLQPLVCCIDGKGLIFASVVALYRLDLGTGEFAEILPPVGHWLLYAASLAPDESRLIYVKPTEDHTIYLRSLETGKETTLSLDKKYTSLGRFVWTEDNRTVFFAAGLWNWADGSSGIALLALDTRTMEAKVLLEEDARQLVPSGELTGETLLLYSVVSGDIYTFDTKTGQLVLITSTPTPTSR